MVNIVRQPRKKSIGETIGNGFMGLFMLMGAIALLLCSPVILPVYFVGKLVEKLGLDDI